MFGWRQGPSWVNANNCAVLTRTPSLVTAGYICEQLWASFALGDPGSPTPNNCDIPSGGDQGPKSDNPEQLCGLDATANPDTEQFGVDPGYAAARNTEQFIARPVRKPDTPETRGWTPDPTLQVNSLFSGFHINLLYRNWLVMGFVRYFHAFLC